MGTGFLCGHVPAFLAMERVFKHQWCDAQFFRFEFFKNLLCIVGPIVIAYSSMVSTNNKVCATKILAYQRMENGFSRTGIAHGGRVHGQEHSALGIIFSQKDFVAS